MTVARSSRSSVIAEVPESVGDSSAGLNVEIRRLDRAVAGPAVSKWASHSGRQDRSVWPSLRTPGIGEVRHFTIVRPRHLDAFTLLPADR